MNVVGTTVLKVEEKQQAYVSAVYDKDLKMTILKTISGGITLETWLPTHKLADLLAAAFDAAASDPASIGYDTWVARNNETNHRLAHVSVK